LDLLFLLKENRHSRISTVPTKSPPAKYQGLHRHHKRHCFEQASKSVKEKKKKSKS
jgi:hypothetical protein